MLAARLRALLDAPRYVPELLALGDGSVSSDEERAAVARYVEQKRNDLHDVADALDADADRETLLRTLATAWLEHRFEWHRHNIVIGYRHARHAAADGPAQARASICSTVIAQLESLLPPAERDRLIENAALLIDAAHDDLARRFGDDATGHPGAPR
jgi:hypothetical protein